ncbi:MAG: EamA family transporter [Clostridia bacterium]|nr:EamA family transporter [Clostridia bacterium]
MKKESSALLQLIGSMFIFGTVGVFVKYIPLPSAVTAMARGFIGALFILLILLFRRTKISFKDIKNNALILFLSGIFLGVNWIFLFEAYRYTSVAVATICYYLAPVFVIIASPFVLKEKITPVKGISVAVSLTGMLFVSGIFESNTQNTSIKGVLFGIGAAAFYACYMLSTKKLKSISSYDGTVVQLLSAAVILVPYVLLTQDFSSFSTDAKTIVLLICVGVLHTGVAYALYFNSLKNLKAQTAAIFSYIDPAVSILASVLFLQEELTLFSVIGGILILGSAVFSEFADNKQ